MTNIESSHTYPNLRAFFAEVRRVLKSGGAFLYTDLLPVQRWAEVAGPAHVAALQAHRRSGHHGQRARLLRRRGRDAGAGFGERGRRIDNFLAVPGSAVYEQMRSGRMGVPHRAREARVMRIDVAFVRVEPGAATDP